MSHPSDSPRTTGILDLNDDVLCETFRHLNALDLTVVADVCSAFKRNALAEFSKRYKFKCVPVGYHANWMRDSIYVWKIDHLLRNFGSLIRSLDIFCTGWFEQRKIMENIVRYFGATLTELKLVDIEFTDDVVPKLQPLLSQLQKFTLGECRWESNASASEMLSWCSEMQALELIRNKTWPFTTVNTFSKLKSFTIIGYSQLQNTSIEIFLDENPQLRNITISSCDRISYQIIQSIGKYVPQIETLDLYIHYRLANGLFADSSDFIVNAEYLNRLSALKSLEINCQFESFSSVMSELVRAGISLESLRLLSLTVDRELIDGIIEMKKLKVIKMTSCRNLESSDVIKIVKNLSEITNLYMEVNLLPTDVMEIIEYAPKMRRCFLNTYERGSTHKIDENMYMKILDVVNERNEKCPLELVWKSARVDVSMKLMKANQAILKVAHDYFVW